MSFLINWTDESKITFNENIEYLSREWDLIAINKFLDRVDDVVQSISHNPNLYPIYRRDDKIYKCVLNKHVTLFYQVINAERIDLITFWNTHQNPTNLRL